MRLLSFVVTGLVSGSLCWWLLYFIPEQLLFIPYVGSAYPGVVLALALLVLGKVLGVAPSGKVGKGAVILVISAVLARELALATFLGQDVLFEYPPYQHMLDFYQQSLVGEMLLQDYGLFPLFWLPSPIVGAAQLFVIALGVTLSWKVSVSRPRVVTRAAIYGALVGLVPAFILNCLPDDLINATLFRDQSPNFALSWLLGNMALIVSPLLWHLLVLMALYMAVGPQSSIVASPDKVSNDRQPENIDDVPQASSVSSSEESCVEVEQEVPDDTHRSDHSSERVSTPVVTKILKSRSRAAKGVSWLLLVGGLLFVGGATRYFYIKSTDGVSSTLASQKMLVQEHVASHPLHALWPELKGCGGGLQTMGDLLALREVGEAAKACETGVLDRLDGEHKDWQETLGNASANLLVTLNNELLVRESSPDSPVYAFWSALAMCDATFDPPAFREEILSGEPMSEYRTRRWDCIKDEMQHYLQKTDEETRQSFMDRVLEEEDLWRLGGRGEYFYLHPHKVWQKGPGDGWEYWEDYRQMEDDGYTRDRPPSGSFLKTLNRAWESGESIRPVDQPDELRPYAHRDMQLLTPIVVDGQTQGIILAEIPYQEMDGYIDAEWQSYYRIVTVIVVVLAIFFLVFQHRKLGTIPKGMDLMWWRSGLWHPSLVLLHRSSDYHHRHLFNIMIFMIFIPPFFYIGEPLIGACALLLPMIFALIALPRVIADYRLFARGISVPCQEVDSRVESVFARAGLGGVSEARYAVITYEAHYHGKTYHISATHQEGMRAPFVALIDPDRGERGLLLNAFVNND